MNKTESISVSFLNRLKQFNPHNGVVLLTILIIALGAFEIFNYSTTSFALTDLLGDLRFAGLRWATILAIAFCGIDFAGIARLFMPNQQQHEGSEHWYLFGAWLLAALMNAILTWWGVTMAIRNHTITSLALIESANMIKIVPIFIAIMIWVIRILLIGMLSSTVNRMFNPVSAQAGQGLREIQVPQAHPAQQRIKPMPQPMPNYSARASQPRTVAPSATAKPRAVQMRTSQPVKEELTYEALDEGVSVPVQPRPQPAYHAFSDPYQKHEQQRRF